MILINVINGLQGQHLPYYYETRGK